MKPLLISSGEPAGVGPDLCISLANYNLPIVILGNKLVLQQRAELLKQKINFVDYEIGKPVNFQLGTLPVYSLKCNEPVTPGVLNSAHGSYVLNLLKEAALLCEQQHFSALVTAPVHKANINAAGFSFTGHTEFFAEYYKAPQVVMMLACEQIRVALVTTHLPLRQVPEVISSELIIKVIQQLHQSLIRDFAIQNPLIKVAGLNPHAGESGYLGREEIDVIQPALSYLKGQGIDLLGPLPADTMFVRESKPCDAYVAMYHDQGLPVLKYAGFGNSVNITLGLPIVRTSVDHGTAFDLAGTNKVDSGSMLMAVRTALLMAANRS
jgi:4-hydroxythreonine-4-phosphate dehydrogenase